MSYGYATASQREELEGEARQAADVERDIKDRISEKLTHHIGATNGLSPSHHPTINGESTHTATTRSSSADCFDDDAETLSPSEGWHEALPFSSLSLPSSSSSVHLFPPALSSGRRLLRVGVVAIRRNLIPGLILQSFALLLLILYFSSPSVQAAFDQVAAFKTQYDLLFSAIVSGIAAGVIPSLIMAAQQARTDRRRRALGKPIPPRVPALHWEALMITALWTVKGVEVDLFYQLQGVMFGTTSSAAVVVPKVLVDMSERSSQPATLLASPPSGSSHQCH